MIALMELQAVAVALAAILAGIAVWAPRRPLVKVSAVVVSVGFMPLAFAGMADLLSKPKPVRLEWAGATMESATVLGAQIKEGQGIFLWLQVQGLPEPRYYKLAWDQKLAEDLHKAMKEAEKTKSGLAMALPFEKSYDKDQPKFYALPQPKLPEKDGDGGTEAPLLYKHPGVDA